MADMPGRPDRIGWRDQVAAARASFRSLAAVGGVPVLVAPLGCLQGVRSLLSRPVRAAGRPPPLLSAAAGRPPPPLGPSLSPRGGAPPPPPPPGRAPPFPPPAP